MLEVEAPGGDASCADLQQYQSSSNLAIDQVELSETEVDELTDDGVLGKLVDSDYHVFVLSETGRPVFMSWVLSEFAVSRLFLQRRIGRSFMWSFCNNWCFCFENRTLGRLSSFDFLRKYTCLLHTQEASHPCHWYLYSFYTFPALQFLGENIF